MAEPRIQPHDGRVAPDLRPLVEAAETEGHAFVQRTTAEWTSGENRFDAQNELFLLAETDDGVVGMCGLNIDQFLGDPAIGRLRHLYVHPDQRGFGLGERLVERCLSHASGRFNLVRLRTPGAKGDRFYDKLGFNRSASDTATHERWL